MALFADAFLVGQGARQISATPIVSVGTRLRTAHGRIYRYVRMAPNAGINSGGTLVTIPTPRADLGPPNLQLAPLSALRVGDTTMTVTLPAGAAAVVPNEYAGGLLCCLAGSISSAGRDYIIDSHTGASGAGQTITIRLAPDDAIDLDNLITDNPRFMLCYNPYSGVTLLNNAATGPVLGVSVVPFTSNNLPYGWVQSGGMSAVNCAGAVAQGALVYPTGSVGQASATATQIAGMPPIGTAMSNCNASGGTLPIFLTIE